MSRFEELCQAYAAAKKASQTYRDACYEFCNIIVNRMIAYFQCHIEKEEPSFDDEYGFVNLRAIITVYENPSDTQNFSYDLINIDFTIVKKIDCFIVTVQPYGNDFKIPLEDLTILNEVYKFIEYKIKEDYEQELQLWLGKNDTSRELGWNF